MKRSIKNKLLAQIFIMALILASISSTGMVLAFKQKNAIAFGKYLYLNVFFYNTINKWRFCYLFVVKTTQKIVAML